MVPMFLLFVVSGSVLAEGLNAADLKQMGAIVKRLEAKIEKQEARIEEQDAVINELLSKYERMKTKANKTEEALVALRDTKLVSTTGDNKAVRDSPNMM